MIEVDSRAIGSVKMTRRWRNYWKIVATSLLLGATIVANACSQETGSQSAVVDPEVIRISIGTQDQAIDTAIGGATVREKSCWKSSCPSGASMKISSTTSSAPAIHQDR